MRHSVVKIICVIVTMVYLGSCQSTDHALEQERASPTDSTSQSPTCAQLDHIYQCEPGAFEWQPAQTPLTVYPLGASSFDEESGELLQRTSPRPGLTILLEMKALESQFEELDGNRIWVALDAPELRGEDNGLIFFEVFNRRMRAARWEPSSQLTVVSNMKELNISVASVYGHATEMLTQFNQKYAGSQAAVNPPWDGIISRCEEGCKFNVWLWNPDTNKTVTRQLRGQFLPQRYQPQSPVFVLPRYSN